MDELVEWLKGVLAADEESAREYQEQIDQYQRQREQWEAEGVTGAVAVDVFSSPAGPGYPANVLADIEAKLVILTGHTPTEWPTHAPAICPTCAHWDWDLAPDDPAGAVNHPCPTLRTLASAYRHRPGWKPEWAV